MTSKKDFKRYNRRDFLKTLGLCGAALTLPGCKSALKKSSCSSPKPNFVIIFTDDQGFQDVGCFGSPLIKTPNLDRMAAEGMKFVDFYAAASVCSPSRAALLTGCYPQRVSIPGVLFPDDKIGLNPQEITIADTLKEQGYATACIGKWHLGHLKPFLPTKHGFDYYFGIPYSNDMKPRDKKTKRKFPPLPLIENEEAIEVDPDQSQLTKRYTEKAVEFIKQNKDKPFFLYLPHTMPHVPLYASENFKGKSNRGLYGDVIGEIDQSTGKVLKTLKQLGIDEQTVVVFTSDNGPWLSKGENGGSAMPLRAGKMTTYEGGMREPCIMRWPGKIPAGSVCSEIATTMDIYPTFAKLAGAKIPKDRVIDGKDILPLMTTPDAKTPHKEFFYYHIQNLQAVRSGHWKLILPHPDRRTKKTVATALYNLKDDIRERNDVSAQHPDIVKRLTKAAQKMRAELGDAALNIKGTGVRPPGQL
jgi:arylsulfatase A-like enzyme